jgi:ketopantoate reductase
MKILIVGTGVIGTIHGMLLKQAGLDITHVIHQDTAQNNQTLKM